jgi:hypothetical protein
MNLLKKRVNNYCVRIAIDKVDNEYESIHEKNKRHALFVTAYLQWVFKIKKIQHKT